MSARERIPFDVIAAAALSQARTLLPQWFPEGKFVGHEFAVGNIRGEPGDSLQFNVTKGVGQDFASGERFGDMIDLYAGRFGLEIGKAARELAHSVGVDPETEETAIATSPPPPPAAWQDPPPDVSIARDVFDGSRGVPSKVYPYRATDGRLLFVTARYEADPKRGMKTKAVIPFVWRDGAWISMAPPKPRPLYGLDRLAKFKPERKVIVVEGERCADAAQRVLDGNPVLTWMGGGMATHNADWTPLEGRTVVLWPDADQPGEVAAQAIADSLIALGCEVHMIDVADRPNAWDVADAVESQNWAKKPVLEFMRERSRPYVVQTQLEEIDGVAPTRQSSPGPVARKPRGRPPGTGEPKPPRPLIKIGKEPKPKPVVEPPPRVEAPRPPGRAPGGGPPNPVQPAATVTETAADESQIELWARMGLQTSDKGKPFVNLDNAVRILSHTLTHDQLHYDSFLNQMRYDPDGKGAFVKLQDEHILGFQLMIQRRVGLSEMNKWTLEDAVALLGRQRRFNSLQAWLMAAQWDGTPRLDTFFVRAFGAVDSPYHRTVSRCFLLSMVARAMDPGCQVDTMPILEGSQGIGKSRGLAALGGQWYADVDSPIGSKEFAEAVQGKWLIEISELSAMRASEVERVKSGITRVVDVYREPFARLATDHPRQCVFAGTTNAETYLTDSENRRFWPIQCGTIDRDWIAENREQLFAEARAALDEGASWWEIDRSEAKIETEKRQVADEVIEAVRTYASAHPGKTAVREILAHWEIPMSQWTIGMQKRVAQGLRACGYALSKRQGMSVWIPPDMVAEREAKAADKVTFMANMAAAKARRI